MYVGNLDFQTDAVRHFSHEYTCTPPRSVSRRGGTVAARLRLALAGSASCGASNATWPETRTGPEPPRCCVRSNTGLPAREV